MTKTSTLRRRLASRNTFVVTFTKRDGSLRTMRLKYEGGPIRGTMMQVRDLDKEAVRTVNLSTIHTLGEVKPKAAVTLVPAVFNPASMTCDEIASYFG